MEIKIVSQPFDSISNRMGIPIPWCASTLQLQMANIGFESNLLCYIFI